MWGIFCLFDYWSAYRMDIKRCDLGVFYFSLLCFFLNSNYCCASNTSLKRLTVQTSGLRNTRGWVMWWGRDGAVRVRKQVSNIEIETVCIRIRQDRNILQGVKLWWGSRWSPLPNLRFEIPVSNLRYFTSDVGYQLWQYFLQYTSI